MRLGITLISSLLLLCNASNAEVLYTDFRPDLKLEKNLEKKLLDVNKDGKPDFAVWLFLPMVPNQVTMTSFGKNEILSTSARGEMVFPLFEEKTNFSNDSGTWKQAQNSFSPNTSATDDKTTESLKGGFIGLRIFKNDRFHYGWLQVELDLQNNQLIIKGYALETNPETAIEAGDKGTQQVETDPALDLVITPPNKQDEESYIRFMFRPALDESRVKEYRVFLVRQEQVKFFSTDQAKKTNPEDYITLIPNGRAHVGKFDHTMKDATGKPIAKGKSYQAMVWSVAQGIASIDVLSAPSGAITLEEDTEGLSITSDLTPTQDSNNTKRKTLASSPPSTTSPVNPKPEREYPKPTPRDFKLFSSGKNIIFRTELTSINPISNISVYDIHGRAIGAKKIDGQEVILNLSHAPEGIYTVKVNFNNQLIQRNLFIR